MVRIVVDRTRCAGLGLCEAVAPDVFAVHEDGELHLRAASVPEHRRDELTEAVDGCPTQALALEDPA